MTDKKADCGCDRKIQYMCAAREKLGTPSKHLCQCWNEYTNRPSKVMALKSGTHLYAYILLLDVSVVLCVCVFNLAALKSKSRTP